MQLLQPLPLRAAIAPNRVMFGPHVTNLGDDQRRFTARHTAYYERRARGGCGVIVTRQRRRVRPSTPTNRGPLMSRTKAAGLASKSALSHATCGELADIDISELSAIRCHVPRLYE